MPSTNKRNYRRKSRRTRTVSKKVAAAPVSLSKLTSLIKRINLRQSEVKYKSRVINQGAMTHNSIYRIPIWDADALVGPVSILPGQGVTDKDRIGDRIHAKKIKLRMSMDIPYDRKNVKVKIYFLEYNSDQGDPTNQGVFQHTVTGKTALDPVQIKRWGKSLRYLGTYTPQLNTNFMTQTTVHNQGAVPADEISANTATIMLNKDILLNRKIFFTSDGATTPSNLKENGVLLIMPFATSNTSPYTTVLSPGDTVVLTASAAATLYYKDL